MSAEQMTEQHTPGPWWLDLHCNVQCSAGLVAFPCISSGLPQRANGLLVAAAPDLLKALRDIEVGANTVDGCYSRNPGNFAAALRDLREYAEAARVAIAKAVAL